MEPKTTSADISVPSVRHCLRTDSASKGQADMPLEIPLHWVAACCSACAMTARVETRLRAGLICQAYACKAREEQRSEGLDRVPCGSHIVEEWWALCCLYVGSTMAIAVE